MIMAYCVKCKAKKEMKNTSSTKTKKGVPMTRGKCVTCNTNMCRLGK